MSTIDIHDIFTKVAAASRNPATPAKASGQKPGSVNVGGHPAPYVAGGGSAEKHKAGDLNPTGTEHQGYVALGGPKPAGKQTAGDLGTHGSPDGGERGSLLGSNLTVTKDAAARPHLSAQGVSDANTTTADVNGASGGGSRAWLKNQGVAGANTMTKDASFEELGMVAGIAAFEDHWKTAEFNEALAVLEANGFDVDKVADVAGFKMNKAKMIGGMIGDKGKSMYGAASGKGKSMYGAVSDKAKSMSAPARSRAETLKGAYTGVPVSGMPRVGGAAAGPGGKAGVRAVMDQLSGKEKAVAGAGLAAAAIGTGLAVNKVRKILKKRREAKAEGR